MDAQFGWKKKLISNIIEAILTEGLGKKDGFSITQSELREMVKTHPQKKAAERKLKRDEIKITRREFVIAIIDLDGLNGKIMLGTSKNGEKQVFVASDAMRLAIETLLPLAKPKLRQINNLVYLPLAA